MNHVYAVYLMITHLVKAELSVQLRFLDETPSLARNLCLALSSRLPPSPVLAQKTPKKSSLFCNQ